MSRDAPGLTIEPGAWRAILDHARLTYPLECCGVLLGRTGPSGCAGRTVTLAIACRNAHAGDRRGRFYIQPGDLLAANKRARAGGLDLVGYYHSHPGGPAYFSAADLAGAQPGKSNLVVSFQGGVYAGAASFAAAACGTRAEPEPLLLPG